MVLKINLIGHCKSGKTNFARRVMGETEVIEPHIDRKLEVYIVEIGLDTNGTKKTVVAKIYDCGSEPPCIANREGYHKNSDGAIVMFGACGPELSFLELRAWQAVGNNRAHPIVYVDQKVLEKPGKDHLNEHFTHFFRLLYNDPRLEVFSLNPL